MNKLQNLILLLKIYKINYLIKMMLVKKYQKKLVN
jgi:hypothetical protein